MLDGYRMSVINGNEHIIYIHKPHNVYVNDSMYHSSNERLEAQWYENIYVSIYNITTKSCSAHSSYRTMRI